LSTIDNTKRATSSTRTNQTSFEDETEQDIF
jgi:hypothetical protein